MRPSARGLRRLRGVCRQTCGRSASRRARRWRCSGPGRPTWGSPSIGPVTTTTRTTSCPAAHPPAPPKKLSTAPAASTWPTRPSGGWTPDVSAETTTSWQAVDRSAGPISASDGLSGGFDRDSDADLVTSRFTQFGYRLNTGGSFGPEIRIAAVAAGSNGRSVALGDADGDGDLDAYALVTNIPAATDPPDFIYRNDGLRFTPVPVPSAGGAGNAVTALDGNGDGRTEFLLLNGAGKAGVSQGIQLVFLLASSTRREVYAEYFNDSANLATIPSWATE